MTEKKPSIKSTIRNYILTIGGLLQEELSEPQFEFGFKFLYPSKNGRPMIAVKPKKRSHIEISLGTNLAPQHREKFISLPEPDKRTFAKQLQKLLFSSEVEYTYNLSQHCTIVVIDKVFIEHEGISINEFYKSVRKVLSTTMNVIFFIQDFFSDDLSSIEFSIQ